MKIKQTFILFFVFVLISCSKSSNSGSSSSIGSNINGNNNSVNFIGSCATTIAGFCMGYYSKSNSLTSDQLEQGCGANDSDVVYSSQECETQNVVAICRGDKDKPISFDMYYSDIYIDNLVLSGSTDEATVLNALKQSCETNGAAGEFAEL